MYKKPKHFVLSTVENFASISLPVSFFLHPNMLISAMVAVALTEIDIYAIWFCGAQQIKFAQFAGHPKKYALFLCPQPKQTERCLLYT